MTSDFIEIGRFALWSLKLLKVQNDEERGKGGEIYHQLKFDLLTQGLESLPNTYIKKQILTRVHIYT
jgi:hypothetical protein